MSYKEQKRAQNHPENKTSSDTPTGEKTNQNKTVVNSPWADWKIPPSDKKYIEV